ncbi:bifunctional diguanylate cyclase/phosphodiesterase [uncultured Vibrio sp.]|uniref:putative bifunctional diguanylate cyclase/phosphodiesterase n=1 Tax=uncultured Vibrio sp. TaxID=114054 RepID=UPI000913C56A|nr:bifunctional diguanylate cyclase/phosphodiesterase [uncultured Vibrio sp.]OIQ24994.1 MAG: GGDEF domain-containing protein [Vibrio sp. MedPE-SWchi]
MFRIALPSNYIEQWQTLMKSLGGALSAQHTIYQFTDEKSWCQLEGENPTQPPISKALAKNLYQTLSHSIYPSTESIPHQIEQGNTCWTTPIWQPDGSLFGALVTHPLHEQLDHGDLIASIAALAGRFSHDLNTLQHHHSAQLPSLQEFLDGLEDHAWIKNLKGEYVVCNRAVESAWGYDASAIIGAEDHHLFDKEIADKFVHADEHIIQSDQQYIVEECPRKDENGDDIWLETIKSPVKRQDGKLIGVLGMTRNVTRRKIVENQLNVTSKIFNNSYEGMMITDNNGHLIEVNQAFTKITGYQEDEVKGRNPRLLKSGLQDATFYRELWQSLIKTGKWKGELSNKRKDGSIYLQKSTITAVQGKEDQLLNYLCVFEDITAHKENEQKLEKMAFYDPLTDLPNRSLLTQILTQQIQSKKPFATLFLDIDHFKHINDSLGHHCGDQVLIELSLRLKSAMYHRGHVARIGGDEFVIVATDLDNPPSLIETINETLSLFNSPFYPNDSHPLHLSTSIGVSRFPQDGTNTDALLKNADTAMYLAKKNGRNGYAYYTPELTDESKSHVRFHSALHQAIKNDEFHLVYQPQFNLVNGSLSGLETLLRWHNPKLGNISPDQFIPIAEKTGLINELGDWVLETACRQGKEWLDSGFQFSKIAVNVSAVQLQHRDFTNRLVSILESTGFPAQNLEIEITEGFLMRDPALATQDLNKLKALGIEVALDDFGTGYSSLSYLKGLPLDKIKVDRSFIHDIPSDGESVAIVSAIIAMAKSLSLEVIAEGIEEPQQQSHLLSLGCSIGQGFYFSKPLNPSDPDNLATLMSLFRPTSTH